MAITSFPEKENDANVKHSQNRESFPAQPFSIQGCVGATDQTFRLASDFEGYERCIPGPSVQFPLFRNVSLQGTTSSVIGWVPSIGDGLPPTAIINPVIIMITITVTFIAVNQNSSSPYFRTFSTLKRIGTAKKKVISKTACAVWFCEPVQYVMYSENATDLLAKSMTYPNM